MMRPEDAVGLVTMLEAAGRTIATKMAENEQLRAENEQLRALLAAAQQPSEGRHRAHPPTG